MRKLTAMLLGLLLLCAPALGEADAPGQATLRFSSFAGGGYEYTVEIGDPSVAGCAMQAEYEAPDAVIDGAGCDFTITFTGLKPGRTTATVYGRSPILENDDSIYTVDVDDALTVTLTPVRAIGTYSLSRFIEADYGSYYVAMDAGGYVVSVDEGPEQPARAEAVEALTDAVEAYDLAAWDGFDASEYSVDDGEDFWLEINLTDGTRVCAQGRNAFPDGYDAAMARIWAILGDIAED